VNFETNKHELKYCFRVTHNVILSAQTFIELKGHRTRFFTLQFYSVIETICKKE